MVEIEEPIQSRTRKFNGKIFGLIKATRDPYVIKQLREILKKKGYHIRTTKGWFKKERYYSIWAYDPLSPIIRKWFEETDYKYFKKR